jgi:hypothetical protein
VTLSTNTALLAAWRRARRPVIQAQHMSQRPDSPLRPDHPDNALTPEAAPEPGELLAEADSPG